MTINVDNEFFIIHHLFYKVSTIRSIHFEAMSKLPEILHGWS